MSLEKQFYVYILASARNGTLYVGVTSALVQRIWQHKNDLTDGFTKKYLIHALVWFEKHEIAESAITGERQIKEWKRKWKLQLIEKENPTWHDRYDEINLKKRLSCRRKPASRIRAAVHRGPGYRLSPV